jgi:hypothetical protein
VLAASQARAYNSHNSMQWTCAFAAHRRAVQLTWVVLVVGVVERVVLAVMEVVVALLVAGAVQMTS